MLDLTDRVIIVTGGGQGIGGACCQLFAEMGAKVVIAEINEETGAANRDAIEAAGGSVLFVQTDIANDASVQAMRDATLEHFGTIDALVNNATVTAYDHDGSVEELSLDKWNHMLDVTLTGALRCIQAAAPAMKRNGYGRIVNFSSIQAVTGTPTFAAYQAAKAGIAALTRAAAIDLAEHGILVNAVQPGWIATPFTGQFESHDDWQCDWIQTGRIRLGRMGKPREVAQLVAFLCSDFCQYITGQVIPIDGGVSVTL